MFRLVILPLLICSLLACPLRCVPAPAIAASDTAIAASATSGCACCAPPVAVESPGAAADGPATTIPASPTDNCGCLSCICEGAVVDSGADAIQMTLVDFGDCIPSGASVCADGGLVNRISRCSDGVSSHGRFLDGRAARIAHRSLLI